MAPAELANSPFARTRRRFNRFPRSAATNDLAHLGGLCGGLDRVAAPGQMRRNIMLEFIKSPKTCWRSS